MSKHFKIKHLKQEDTNGLLEKVLYVQMSFLRVSGYKNFRDFQEMTIYPQLHNYNYNSQYIKIIGKITLPYIKDNT